MATALAGLDFLASSGLTTISKYIRLINHNTLDGATDNIHLVVTPETLKLVLIHLGEFLTQLSKHLLTSPALFKDGRSGRVKLLDVPRNASIANGRMRHLTLTLVF